MADEAGPSKKMKSSTFFQGANLKVYILEDTEVRMGQDHGRKYGVTNVLSKSTEISDYTTVFDTSSDRISEEKVKKWTNPPIKPIAVSKSLEKGDRVSICGTLERRTQILQGKSSQRRILTIKDQTGEVDVKLWGERLMHIAPEEGTRIVVTNVTVDEYRNNKTLNSNMSTRIEIKEDAENFSGKIEAACFDEDSLSLVINENVFNVSADLIEMVFPLLSFEENVEITGQARGNTITTILDVHRQDEM
uniref:Uncharacterized protein n=1 Tax=Magallana gigas TaxID=29159 RepID=A0A8W8MM10_MAGGI